MGERVRIRYKSAPRGALGYTDRLDAVLDAWVPKRIVGCAILVTRFGKPVYQAARGYADLASFRPVQPDTLFRYASLTKIIVSAAFFAMMDRGYIGLDDPVTLALPEFRPLTVEGHCPRITFRHLLSHTSGLGYGFLQGAENSYRSAGVSDGMDQPGISARENLRRLAAMPLAFEPGTAWRYSLSSDVVGAAMEVVAGKPLERIVQELIAKPLDLRSLRFYAQGAEDLASPYFESDNGPRHMAEEQGVDYDAGHLIFTPHRCFESTSYMSGGSGIIGTVGDFTKFLEALLLGRAPLRASSSAMLTADAIGNIPAAGLDLGWRFTLGGFALLVDPTVDVSRRSAGSWRWGGVYGNHWFVDVPRGLTVVVLTNTTPTGMTGAFPEAIRDAVYSEEE